MSDLIQRHYRKPVLSTQTSNIYRYQQNISSCTHEHICYLPANVHRINSVNNKKRAQTSTIDVTHSQQIYQNCILSYIDLKFTDMRRYHLSCEVFRIRSTRNKKNNVHK